MWNVESGLAREAVIGSAVTRWWSRQDGGQTEGLLLHGFETGCGGSKHVTGLRRWELWLERGDVSHLVL